VGSHRRRKWQLATFPIVVASFGIAALTVGVAFGGLGGSGEDTDALRGRPSPTISATFPTETRAAVQDEPTASTADVDDAVPTGTPGQVFASATRSTGDAAVSRTATPSPSEDPPTTRGDGGGVQLPPIDFPTCIRNDHGLHCR